MASHFNSTIVRMLICLEISLFLTSTMAMDYSDDNGRSTKRFCGRMLTESLALICDGQYGAIIPTDRRSDESLDEEYAYNDQPAAPAFDVPIQYQTYAYQSKIAPDAAVRSRVRRDWTNRRGVYDECCRKPCSVQELKSYCKRKN